METGTEYLVIAIIIISSIREGFVSEYFLLYARHLEQFQAQDTHSVNIC